MKLHLLTAACLAALATTTFAQEEVIPEIAKEESLGGKRFVTWKELSEWDNKGLQLRDFTNPKTSWFPTSGVGVVFSYGLLSLDPKVGEFYHLNEGQHNKGVTAHQIFERAKEFNPSEFKPKEWMNKLAKAGVTYVVLTAKGEDGFALWPSGGTDFDVASVAPERDLVKEFVEAARAAKLKVGVVYNANDAHFDGEFRNYGGQNNFVNWKKEPVNPAPKAAADAWTKKEAMVKKEIVELMTNYGKLDVFYPWGSLGGVTMDQLRAASPTMAIANTSLGNKGDFVQINNWLNKPPYVAILNENAWPYEVRESITRGSAYYTEDSEGDIQKQGVILTGHKLRSQGANVLYNIALKPDGSLPEKVKVFLDELEPWMKETKNAWNGVSAGITNKGICNNGATINGNILYMIVSSGHGMADDPVKIVGLPKPSGVQELIDGNKIDFKYDDETKTCTFFWDWALMEKHKVGKDIVGTAVMVKYKDPIDPQYAYPAMKAYGAPAATK